MEVVVLAGQDVVTKEDLAAVGAMEEYPLRTLLIAPTPRAPGVIAMVGGIADLAITR